MGNNTISDGEIAIKRLECKLAPGNEVSPVHFANQMNAQARATYVFMLVIVITRARYRFLYQNVTD